MSPDNKSTKRIILASPIHTHTHITHVLIHIPRSPHSRLTNAVALAIRILMQAEYFGRNNTKVVYANGCTTYHVHGSCAAWI